MSCNNLKVVVAGDVSVDWYFWPRPSYSNEENINWRLYEGLSTSPQPGGAILLSKMIRSNPEVPSDTVIVSQVFDNIDKIDSNQILHTNVKLDLFSSHESNLKEKVYRVDKNFGITTPTIDIQYPKPLDINGDDENAEIVIIHDAGDGFRFEEEKWPKALIEGKKPIVIYNMYPPLFAGTLWDHVVAHHIQKLILVINAEDLRKMGINISRSLSWEKTALEFLWEVNHNEKLECIKHFPNLIIRFG